MLKNVALKDMIGFDLGSMMDDDSQEQKIFQFASNQDFGGQNDDSTPLKDFE